MLTQERLTETLDQLEERLPTIASKTVSFGRATTRRTTAVATAIFDEVSGRVETVADTFQNARRTTTGQASAAVERSTSAVKKGVAEVRGQASAQAERVAGTAKGQTTAALDDATRAIDPDTGSLGDLTKAELYEKAQDRDIDGRASMTKDELIAALQR